LRTTVLIVLEAPIITITDSASGVGSTAICSLNTADVFHAGDQISDGTITINGDVQAITATPTGKGSCVSVDEGVYYTNGFFVRNDAQSIILDKYGNTPTYNVGFDVNESVITSSEDASLLDQAQGTPNHTAPGADRLKISLTLVKKDFDSIDTDDFIMLAQFDSGNIIQIKTVASLGEIEKTLARRTFDESGSYTVRSFPLSIRPHASDPTKLTLALDPGKAFVKGFEHETASTTFIDIDKARDTNQVNGGDISAPLGSYVLIGDAGTANAGDLIGGLNINDHSTVDLHSDIVENLTLTNPSTYASTKVGSAKIRMIEYHSGADTGPFVYRAYVYDIQAIGNVGTTKSFFIPVDDQATPVAVSTSADINSAGLSGGNIVVFESDFNSLLFQFPNKQIKSAKDPAIDTSYTIKKNFSGISFSGAGTGTVTLSGTETFSGSGVQSATIAKTNFHLVVTAVGTNTTFAVGDVIEMSGTGRSVDITGTTTAVLDVNDVTGTFTGDVIATINLDAELETAKTLVKHKSVAIGGANQTALRHDNLFLSDVNTLHAVYSGTLPPRFTIGAITGGPFTIGEVITQSGTGATGTLIQATDSVNLDIVVVAGTFNGTGLLSGADSGATVTPATFTDQPNLKANYKFDGGQTDNMYDHAKLQLISTAPTGPDITVIVDQFTHAFGAGYFTVDSYSNIDYEDIPTYISPSTGKKFKLSDVLDFRPKRKDDNATIDGAVSILVAAGSLTNVAWADANPDTITITGTTFDLSVVKKGSVIWPRDAADAGNRISFVVDSVTSTVITLNSSEAVTVNATDTTLTDFFVRDETMEGAQIPVANTNIQVDYSYYLARNDILYLSKEKRFGILQGVSAERPRFASELDSAITLYKFELNPFTFNESDLTIEAVNHQRFTMKDIGSLHERVKNLEYFTALSIMEAETANKTVLDNSGNERIKHGILIDSFQGHGIGDVSNPDHSCSVDMGKKELRPYVEAQATKFTFDSGNSTNFTKTGDLVTLPYTETNMISQSQVSNFTAPLNPFDVANWRGTLKLTPSSTDFFDVDANAPFLVTTKETHGWWDAWRGPWGGYGYYYGYWGWGWKAWRTTTKTTTTSKAADDVALDHHLDRLVSSGDININSLIGSGDSVPQSVTFDYNGSTVTTSVVPYIAAQTVTITTDMLKPSTRVWPFFDGKDVSSFVTPNGGSAGDPIYTDTFGSVANLTFDIPNTTTDKFLTGEKLFRLIDNPTNNTTTASTFSEAIFHATGAKRTAESSIQSTRSEKITNDIVENTELESTLTSNNKWASLVQTITVDEKLFPDGLFLSGLDLYFKTKPTSNFPVKLDIRNTENDFPGQKILPFTEVVALPADIQTSTDGTTETALTFESPVYLLAGETYAISINSNSKDYLLWTGRVGATKIGSTEKIFKHPYMANLFKSQNTGILVPEPNEMLKMNARMCAFNINVQSTLLFNNVTPAADVPYDAFKLITDGMNFDAGSVSWAKKTTVEGGSIDTAFSVFEPEDNVEFLARQEISNSGTSAIIRTLFDSTSSHISPVIDLDRLSFITIENRINNDTTGETGSNSGNALARYISRRVVLEDGFDATDLKVYLQVNNRSGSSVNVYYKVLSSDDPGAFDDKNWVQMSQTTLSSVVSTSDEHFVELEFSPATAPITYTEGAATYNDFKTWAIKIVMLSANSAIPSRCKGLRAIALS